MADLMESKIQCRELRLRDVRRLKPIRSRFETDRVFRLERDQTGASVEWRLREERLAHAREKLYDSGRVDEWLPSYADVVRPDALRFVAAMVDGSALGLLTWQRVRWNDTLWLVDIRTEESARRLGIGTALIDHLKNVACREKVRGIAVETQITNYPAIRFYRKHCFEITGFNDHLYTNTDLSNQDVALFLFWEVGQSR